MWTVDTLSDAPRLAGRTPGGIAVTVRVTPTTATAGPLAAADSAAGAGSLVAAADPGERFGLADSGRAAASCVEGAWLRVEHARLRLLRGFEELLCLEGLCGVEQLPHQIETVRRVLRHFRGGVLLADEVGLGKTIEACLLLREYFLRGMIRRVLILVPPALVGQWKEELATKFGLEFSTAESGQSIKDDYWRTTDRVLASLSLAKGVRHFDAVTACSWDLVIVDEAHHCRNRATRNWQLVNALQRRRMLLLTATPVQNDLLELYNLLTLLEPGHLKTQTDFRRNYVRRGNPRDPRNRRRLRELLGEVMIRNTRSLVTIDLPRRYAQTLVVQPHEHEAQLYRALDVYLRSRSPQQDPVAGGDQGLGAWTDEPREPDLFSSLPAEPGPTDQARLSRMRITSLLRALGSHPAALPTPLAELIGRDDRVGPILELARKAVEAGPSGKETRLVELLGANRRGKTLVFANFSATLVRLESVLANAGIPFCVFTGRQSAAEKAHAVELLRDQVPVMLCSEIGGEGHNLQFANTLINFDLPWNPMRIEQRVGRIHRIGQTQEVFIFNLCTAGSMEERILRVLHEKIHMFELVVGEVGSILGNLEGGDEFESLVLDLWLRSRGPEDLDHAFEQLGESLLAAQGEYLETKKLDDALFGDEYE